MKQSNSKNHDAAASSHSEDDWIMAYEKYVSQTGPEPEELPKDLSGEDQQQLVEVRQTIDALHAVYGQADESPESSITEPPPQQLGDFRILHEIGRGGMGVVYEAEQISLPRRVALKILPFAAVLDPRHLERFKNEARAAATLHHSGIVAVYSVGSERGVHFFAMEFIEGQSLAEVIDDLQADAKGEQETADRTVDGTKPAQQPASTPLWQSKLTGNSTDKQAFFHRVAQLGAQAAAALDHAHTRGIVHRDIKPGNLLLDTEGQIHVADFGLARMSEDAGVTMTGDVLGTLRYMSPEQALAQRAVLDHRTDIYSLGATLYELLTLKPLFAGKDRQELLRKITQEEPQRPSKLNAKIPSDLETIVLKAIAKDPTDRYATAQALADDLHRFIDGKPVQARRINGGQRLWRWSKRNPIAAALSMSVAALATLVAIVTSIGYARTNVALAQVSEERDAAQVARQEAQQKGHEAQQQRDKALQNLYVSQMNMAQKVWDDGQIARLKQTLLSYLPTPGQPDLRGWEWYFHLSLCFGEEKTLRGHNNGPICSIVWSPDGTSLASARHDEWSESGEIKLWNLETEAAIETISHRGIPGCLFAWHPGERRLAWRVDDSKTAMVVQYGKSRVTIELDANLNSVAWSPDGNRLASNGPNQTVIIWDAKTGERIRELIGHNTEVRVVAWSPDGKQLAATGFEPGTITIWDVDTGEQTATLESGEFNWCLAWSPDSRRLATGTYSGNTLVWDVDSRERILSLVERGGVRSIAWSPDGSRFATGLGGGNITLRDASSGKVLHMFRHDRTIGLLLWSPNGKRVASGDLSGVVKIWDVVQDQDVRDIADDAATSIGGIAFSPDDRSLAYWATGQTIKIRDVATSEEIQTLPGPEGDGLRPKWSPDGKQLACGGDDGSIVVYDIDQDEVRNWQHEGVKASVSTDTSRSVNLSWHPNGRQLASVSEKESIVRIWDAPTGKQLSSFDSGNVHEPGMGGVWDVAWSPNGHRLAIARSFTERRGKGVMIWDRIGWRRLHTIETTSSNIIWNHDGRYLATGTSGKGPITILDTATGRPVQTLTGHTGRGHVAGWSADDRRLASVSQDGVRIWNPQTGQELFSILGAKSMAWSHDRQRIATIENGKVRIYDASLGYKLAADPSFLSQ